MILIVRVVNKIVNEKDIDLTNKEPIKEEPIKEEPIKEEPIKEEPIKEEPINVELIEDSTLINTFNTFIVDYKIEILIGVGAIIGLVFVYYNWGVIESVIIGIGKWLSENNKQLSDDKPSDYTIEQITEFSDNLKKINTKDQLFEIYNNSNYIDIMTKYHNNLVPETSQISVDVVKKSIDFVLLESEIKDLTYLMNKISLIPYNLDPVTYIFILEDLIKKIF